MCHESYVLLDVENELCLYDLLEHCTSDSLLVLNDLLSQFVWQRTFFHHLASSTYPVPKAISRALPLPLPSESRCYSVPVTSMSPKLYSFAGSLPEALSVRSLPRHPTSH